MSIDTIRGSIVNADGPGSMSAPIRGFINISTGRPAACDTEVSLVRERDELVVHALCRCDGAGVPAADRLVITFDPAGREADALQLAVAPDGTFACSQLGTRFPYTDPTWAAEPYPFPATVETTLADEGWRVTVRLPLAHMFAEAGGVPETFRLNVARIWDNREWSYWPLADATFGESVFAFPLVRLGGVTSGVTVEAAPASAPVQPCATPGEPLPFRGVMYDTSRSGKIYDVETFVRFVDWLAVCGCTHFMPYFENGFRYRSHPAFAAPEALDADGVRRLDAACRQHGMELVLAQTTFGHMPGILRHPDYVHLAEDGHPYQLCPSHPDAYRFLGELLDELIPLSRSAYFNVNCDESRLLGLCPKCRERGADAPGKEAIFLDHLLWLHAKVREHGRRMMVWSDQLLRMPAILDTLPRDIVVLDWQYFNWVSFPTLSFFRERGFEVIGCPSTRLDNIRTMTADCQRRGTSGVLDTIWEAPDGGLALACPGIYMMGRIARGDTTTPDEVLLAEAEELIWPGNAPGLAWKLLIDHNGSLSPALSAKLKRDTVRALRRAVPAPRFAWIARQLIRLMEKGISERSIL